MASKIGAAWSGFHFELWAALVCMITGLPLGLGLAPSPQSMASILPVIGQWLWGITLTLGGSSVIYGILWRAFRPAQFVAGLYIERAGLYMLSSSVGCFVVAVVVFAGAPSLFAAAIIGAFVAACLSRSRSIGKEIHIIKEHGGNG